MRLANKLLVVLRCAMPISAALLSEVRWLFASSMSHLLATKERHIYSKLQKDEGSEIRKYQMRSRADLTQRYEAYIGHMDAQPTYLSVDRWSTCRIGAIAVVESFVEFLRRKEIELYPLIARH
jgi:hypothetical protein